MLGNEKCLRAVMDFTARQAAGSKQEEDSSLFTEAKKGAQSNFFHSLLFPSFFILSFLVPCLTLFIYSHKLTKESSFIFFFLSFLLLSTSFFFGFVFFYSQKLRKERRLIAFFLASFLLSSFLNSSFFVGV